MTYKRLVITIVLAAFILTLIPAAMAAGGTISGKVAFPANTTLWSDINKTVGVDSLTIYAMNINTGFVNTTIPLADGTYSIKVPENGLYRIWVYPDEVVDATDYNNLSMAQYPQRPGGDREYYITVSGNTKADINYFPPGKYVPPNDLTSGSPTPSTTTVTPRPASGFAILLALVGLAGAFAIVSRRK